MQDTEDLREASFICTIWWFAQPVATLHRTKDTVAIVDFSALGPQWMELISKRN